MKIDEINRVRLAKLAHHENVTLPFPQISFLGGRCCLLFCFVSLIYVVVLCRAHAVWCYNDCRSEREGGSSGQQLPLALVYLYYL